MTTQAVPDILVYLCKNCIPEGGKLPAQWSEDGLHVRTKQIPCSGKIDAQYILHSLEGGVKGVCVVTCPHGECTLAQGNYRAEMRVNTVQRLLSEIGDNPRRAALIQCPSDTTADSLAALIGDAVRRYAGKGEFVIDK
jgi:F420-non-reducing hydrogenase iron-sulfur subunit